MTSASLADVQARLTAKATKSAKFKRHKQLDVTAAGQLSRFRPNLLVGGLKMAAYAEDTWQEVHIGSNSFFTAGMADIQTLQKPSPCLHGCCFLRPARKYVMHELQPINRQSLKETPN